MFITNKEELKEFYSENRIWQGIPGIAVTKKGRVFSAFYSGGIKEDIGNFVLLKYSDDDGKTFSRPIAVCYNGKETRCFDPVVWIDPKNRLWLF